MADFPSTLPAPSVNGYGIAPGDATARTEMEVGEPRVRRRTSAPPEIYSFSWRFTDAQMDTFRTWFTNTSTGAAHGAQWFNISLADGYTGLATRVARFVGPWKSTALPGLNWDVAAQLEVRQ